MAIHVFSKSEWDAATAWPGFEWTRIIADKGQLRYEYDLPFKAEGAPSVTIQVWSSIDSEMLVTRPEAGDDSIRFVVKYNDDYWKWPGNFWITRQPGWEKRLKAKFIKHLDMIAPRTGGGKRALRRCTDCGGFLLPAPKRKPTDPAKTWYLKCYGTGGMMGKCFHTWTGKDGRVRDKRWKGWIDG